MMMGATQATVPDTPALGHEAGFWPSPEGGTPLHRGVGGGGGLGGEHVKSGGMPHMGGTTGPVHGYVAADTATGTPATTKNKSKIHVRMATTSPHKAEIRTAHRP